MTRSFADFDSTRLSGLSAQKAVELFRSLLWCHARQQQIPVDSITISIDVNVPDGGIDADIAPNGLPSSQGPLTSGNTFFQIKAGRSATPWQKSWIHKELIGSRIRPSKAELGEAVRHCLGRRGRYVLVCFGCDLTGDQQRKSLSNLTEFFKSCGYKAPRVTVLGQGHLAALIQPFPSIRMQLTQRHDLAFWTHDEWRRDAQMSVRMHLGEAQRQVIEEVHSLLRGTEKRHIRIIGEPGLGKTRLVLEALSESDLSPTVIYVRHPEDFQQSALFNTVLRADDVSSMTLVIDDCPPKERASIWSVLRQRSDRIRLLTLDHGPENSTDTLMEIIECPALEEEKVKEIIAEYIGSGHEAGRWAEFCSGSPRVAHAVGENLRRNPDDILKEPASVPVWDRYVHGNGVADSQEGRQREIVLRHISLFHKFGFEPPVDEEARFVAGLAKEADPAITWHRFQSLVKHFRDRRVLQGQNTLFLVPRALHIHLWLQFWDNYGSGTDVVHLVTRMPRSMLRWFTEMFKYGHASRACSAIIERLTSAGGPFDESNFIAEGPGAAFLNELAEAHPEATLRCIERTVGRWPRDALLGFHQGRQQIVWALEKLAIWKDLFPRAAGLLLKLAMTENASNSNNATGTFRGLFAMGQGTFASSEAPPELRVPVLREILESSDATARGLGLEAAAAALAAHPHVHMVGPEYQGMRPLPSLWQPKTTAEVRDAYIASWKLIVRFWQSAISDEKKAAAKVLIEAASWLVRQRDVEGIVLSWLKDLAECPHADLHPLVELIGSLRRSKWHGVSRKVAAALRSLDAKTYGDTTESQIWRLTVLGTWSDIDSDGEPYGKRHTQKLHRLAKHVLQSRATLCRLVPRLSSASGFFLRSFGSAMGNEDRSCRAWIVIWNSFAEAGDQRTTDFITGYLQAMFPRNPRRWTKVVFSLLSEPVGRRYARELITHSGMTGTVLNELCAAVKRGDVSADVFTGFGNMARHYGIPATRCVEFIAWCLQAEIPSLVQAALGTAHRLLGNEEDAASLPEQLLLDLVTSPHVLASDDKHESHYKWAVVTEWFAKRHPHRASQVFESVLKCFTDFGFVATLRHSNAQAALLQLIHLDPTGSWHALSNCLCSQRSYHLHNVTYWLRPDGERGAILTCFDASSIMAWIDADPKSRAASIARVCPKTVSTSEGGSLTRELIIRYGHQDDVKGALWVNFQCEGSISSDHFRKKRDEARRWLSMESSSLVRTWLDNYIADLGHQIAEEEVREERRF